MKSGGLGQGVLRRQGQLKIQRKQRRQVEVSRPESPSRQAQRTVQLSSLSLQNGSGRAAVPSSGREAALTPTWRGNAP